MIHLNLRQLQAFRAVMQQGTISGAAETLNLSQPAVSKLIANLEDHLQFPLFHRDKKRISATTEAYIFLKEVDDTFNRLERLRETAEALQQTRNEVIRVGAMAMVGLTVMPQIIWEFHPTYPNAQVSLQIRLSQNLVDLVGAGQLDAAISQASHEVAGVKAETLRTCHAVCVLPEGHRLTEKEEVSVKDIAKEPLISLTDGAQLRNNVDASFAAAGVRPTTLTTVQLAMAACQFVRISRGVTIVDPITANSPNNRDLIIRPIVEKIEVPIFLYTSASVTKSQGLEQFIAYCRQRFSLLEI
jgi:DNA-binding transcriptional LysR family regulator